MNSRQKINGTHGAQGYHSAVVEQEEPTFQFKKELISIDEYAEREGLSRDIIESCAKAGIVQVRKHRGKAFVVDVPLSPYFRNAFDVSLKGQERIREVAQPPRFLAKARAGVSGGKERGVMTSRPSKGGNPDIVVGSISELVKRMFKRACRFISSE